PRPAPLDQSLRAAQARSTTPDPAHSSPGFRRNWQGEWEMNRAIFLSIFILSLAAGGCHLNQQKEVARYRKVLDADAPPIEFTPGAPLSLEQALALANQHNERLGLL